ncbi:MAG: hypothetical protein Q8P51_02775 [Ignavibacteria bacterium]|nr:hypothetical protein [Ignavibacteria bacterium]
MKLLGTMNRCSKVQVSCLVISLLVSGWLHGSVLARQLTPKLSESEIRSVISILKAEIAGYSQLEKGIQTDRDARQALFEGIKSGKIDPLAWLKQRSKYVIVPPGAVYEPACSRAASIMGWDSPGRQDPEIAGVLPPPVHPTAIFTLGKEIPAINKHLLGTTITGESYRRFRENPTNTDHPSYKEIRPILANIQAFYIDKGFSADYSMGGNTVKFYPYDAEGEITGTVWDVQIDLFDPLNPDVVKNCRSHPMGPSIEIRAGDKLMEKAFKPAETKVGTDDVKIKSALQKAGITEDRYGEIKGALIMARTGSQSPEEEEPAALDFKPSTPEEKQAAEAIEMMKKEIRAKKNNIQLYNKYKAELDPILDVLQKYMGGQ